MGAQNRFLKKISLWKKSTSENSESKAEGVCKKFLSRIWNAASFLFFFFASLKVRLILWKVSVAFFHLGFQDSFNMIVWHFS